MDKVKKFKSMNPYHWKLDFWPAGCAAVRWKTDSAVCRRFASLNLCYLVCLGSMYTCASVTLSGSPSVSNGSPRRGHIRGSGRFGHTLTWPLSPDPDAWSRRPAPLAPEGNGASPGASRSLSPTPAWLWPSASCENSNTNIFSEANLLPTK